MTSKERVLQVYPDAQLVGWTDGACAIHVPSARKYLGWGQEKFNVSSIRAAQQAWDDAASNLPSAPSPAGETASEPVSTEGAAHIMRCPRCSIVDGVYCDEWRKLQPTAQVAAPIAPAAGSETAMALLGDVMHLWVDGYISKAPNSCADDSVSGGVFDKISKLLDAQGIEVDYCGWRKPSAEGDGRIAELRDGLKLVRLALADEDLDGVPTWTRMRFWLNQRDIYNGDLQEHRVTLAVVEALLTRAEECKGAKHG